VTAAPQNLQVRFFKAFARRHTRLLVRTRGRPSWSGPRLRFLVLETRGRRSGQPRSVVLLYLAHAEDFVVLASNFGGERPPAWWVNLVAQPEALVHLSGRTIPVRARALSGKEREAMLARAVSYNRQWRGYTHSMHRELPVVLLERMAPGVAPAKASEMVPEMAPNPN
jgi:deazaflavin-dependent oxidoreductase (nitroreductase family)